MVSCRQPIIEGFDPLADGTALTVGLNDDLKRRLDELASATKRSKSALAAEAIAAYLDLNAGQIDAINQGLAAADRGELIADQDIEDWVESWNGDKAADGPGRTALNKPI